MKFIIVSLILFIGMYVFAAKDELQAYLDQSTCKYTDSKGTPIPHLCDGIAQELKESKDLSGAAIAAPDFEGESEIE